MIAYNRENLSGETFFSYGHVCKNVSLMIADLNNKMRSLRSNSKGIILCKSPSLNGYFNPEMPGTVIAAIDDNG